MQCIRKVRGVGCTPLNSCGEAVTGRPYKEAYLSNPFLQKGCLHSYGALEDCSRAREEPAATRRHGALVRGLLVCPADPGTTRRGDGRESAI